jgi:hypothetical protein
MEYIKSAIEYHNVHIILQVVLICASIMLLAAALHNMYCNRLSKTDLDTIIVNVVLSYVYITVLINMLVKMDYISISGKTGYTISLVILNGGTCIVTLSNEYYQELLCMLRYSKAVIAPIYKCIVAIIAIIATMRSRLISHISMLFIILVCVLLKYSCK